MEGMDPPIYTQVVDPTNRSDEVDPNQPNKRNLHTTICFLKI